MNPSKKSSNFQILILSLTLVAVLLLASGLPNLRFEAGERLNLYAWLMAAMEARPEAGDISPGVPPPHPANRSLFAERALVVFFWVLLIFSILYAFISPQFRKELIRMMIIVLLVALFLPQIAEQFKPEAQAETGAELPGNFSQLDTTIPEPPPFVQHPPRWLLILFQVLFLALLTGGVYWILRKTRRKPDPKTVVVENIKQALSDMETGSEFKDVVIACYARMCRELHHSRGIQRNQVMTPREFETRLSQAGITSDHIKILTRLFEDVRYGSQSTDSATETRAVHSLNAILQAYGE